MNYHFEIALLVVAVMLFLGAFLVARRDFNKEQQKRAEKKRRSKEKF